MTTTTKVSDAQVSAQFRDQVADGGFPCVGAKSALARGTLNTMVCRDIRSAWDDLRIHDALLDWSTEYEKTCEGFRSLAVLFRDTPLLTENDFETALWERIQSLADKDHWRGQPYDAAVSPDPSDPHFGLSFGGQAYFVVGMHPGASRPARKSAMSAMVFNLHDQFEQLRTQGRYERMREAILERDRNFAGSVNPMLERHGDASEAAQYSGRKVGSEWTCPLRDKRRGINDTDPAA